MSLIRTGLVLGAVVYAMPADTQKQAEMIRSTSDTLVWGLTYCDREPKTCEDAKVAWDGMVKKAQFGAALASDIAATYSDARRNHAPDPLPPSQPQAPATRPPAPRTIEDLLVEDPANDVAAEAAAELMATRPRRS